MRGPIPQSSPSDRPRIRGGWTGEAAAASFGISTRTVRKWVARERAVGAAGHRVLAAGLALKLVAQRVALEGVVAAGAEGTLDANQRVGLTAPLGGVGGAAEIDLDRGGAGVGGQIKAEATLAGQALWTRSPAGAHYWVRTNTSKAPLVSPGTKFEASELNTTRRPSEDNPSNRLRPLPSAPLVRTLTLRVAPAWRSWTKLSPSALVSPATRFVASELNATKRPSAEIAPPPVKPSA